VRRGEGREKREKTRGEGKRERRAPLIEVCQAIGQSLKSHF
jgi:hypothetical protein